jgi:hypothetical protein
MRKLFWMIILFAIYVWVMTSGRDHLLIEQGKSVYQALVAWFDDADVDFQVKKTQKAKKHRRRWD